MNSEEIIAEAMRLLESCNLKGTAVMVRENRLRIDVEEHVNCVVCAQFGGFTSRFIDGFAEAVLLLSHRNPSLEIAIYFSKETCSSVIKSGKIRYDIEGVNGEVRLRAAI